MSDEFKDEHSGKGGSYVIDADGKRVLQERTVPAAEQNKAASTIAGKSTVKGATNAKSN